jgi:hypothetical protein
MTTASSIQTENLAGKRALVSGGTRGTGAAVTARLKAESTRHRDRPGPRGAPHRGTSSPADITTVDGTDKRKR